jgi:vitamin B12 transporter
LSSLSAQSLTEGTAFEMSPLTILSPRIANQEAVATVSTPVSALRYEPGVDLQSRNFAEGQADVAIRGGTFANTGFGLAGLPLYDPQTGHYYSEIPVAPGMLTAPKIAVGADLATGGGWNATAGAVNYGWRPVREGGEIGFGLGEWTTRRGDFLAGVQLSESWAADVGVSYSESDGPFANADHQMVRYSGRLQRRAEGSATDLVIGYQDKFFGWPNLYTPFNSPETEDIQTLLLAATHRQDLGGDGSFAELGTYWRKNDDDYAFNRFSVVGPVRPFNHTTHVTAAGGRGHWVLNDVDSLDVRFWVLADELRSTSLTFGKFTSRTHVTGGVYYHHVGDAVPEGIFRFRGGVGYDSSNRGEDAITPVIELAWERSDGPWKRFAVSYSTASQAPSYTAVAGNPTGGLFRGNSSLDRATSRTADLKATFEVAGWVGAASVFHRWDDELVDWTFRSGFFARSAAAVDLETSGVEFLASRGGEHWDVVLGYSWLEKSADYGVATVDGSFYALNFPTHRLTAALVWRATDSLDVRFDNEFRVQEPNPLRRNATDETWLSTIGVYWRTPWAKNLQLSLQADNLWDADFEEIPAVPAAPRMIAIGARWHW